MAKFQFKADAEAKAYCERIAQEMVRLFGIPEAEAVGRINRQWKGQKLGGEGEVLYGGDPPFWAKTIYYESGCMWWREGEKLRPKPYP